MKQKVGKYSVEMEGDRLYIGDSPQLVVNLKTQKNFIRCKNENIPYKKEIRLSPDFLEGKRPEVFKTAVGYYYQQACEIADGIQIARAYGRKANRTISVKDLSERKV